MDHIVYITNAQRTVTGIRVIKAAVRAAVDAALSYEKVDYQCEVSVTLCDNKKMRALNLQSRGIDSTTDVLSFPMLEGGDIAHAGPVPLGDIVISLPRARAQAGEYGHTFLRELSFLTVHGVLHLLGYDHELSECDEREMFGRQEKILSEMGINR